MGPKKTVLIVFSAMALLGASGGYGDNDVSVRRNVAPKEAFALIRENAENGNFVVLDVRTPSEFAGGHLQGAVLIDYRSPSFRQEASRLDRDKAYLVYCRTANRSAHAVGIMEELGFRKILHLSGGIVRWSEEGLPVVGMDSGEGK